MRVLVTGSAGFIGGHVVRALAARGDAVLTNDPKQADSFDLDQLADGKVDGIIHLGAISDTMEDDTKRLLATNYELPQRLWNYCAGVGDVPLIYASSAAVYGDGAWGFQEDAGLPHMPLNQYGKSKLAFDKWAAVQSSQGSRPSHWAGLRFFNVYGPGEERKGRMASMVSKAKWAEEQGIALPLFNHGQQMRDFVYVDDVVAVTLWALDQLGPRCSGLYNVGTGHAVPFRDMVEAVGCTRIDWTDMPAKIRRRFQHYTRANVDRLRRAGYDAPFLDLRNGMIRYRAEAG